MHSTGIVHQNPKLVQFTNLITTSLRENFPLVLKIWVFYATELH